MIDNRTLDALTEKLTAALPDSVKLMQKDLESNFRSVLEAAFSKMNLVSREEFDVQAALLARTREKLEQLEQQITDLEKDQ